MTRDTPAPIVLCIGKNGQLARALSRVAKTRQITLHRAGRDEIDLFDARAVEDYIGEIKPAAIINTAAFTRVDDAETDADSAYKLNCDAARQVAIAAQTHGARLLHISTDYVFSGQKSGTYAPEDETAPQGVYGHTKRAGEAAVQASNPNAIIIRTSWLYGPDAPNFLMTMLRLAKGHSTIRVVDDQIGSPTYVDDLAAGLLDAALAQGPGGIFHLSGQGHASWAQLARHILAVSAQLDGPTALIEAITTADYPTPAKRPKNSCLDSALIEARYGIKLPQWRDGVVRCLEHIRGAGWGTV